MKKNLNKNDWYALSKAENYLCCKYQITKTFSETTDQIIILDTENEYSELVKELGGKIFKIDRTNYVNIPNIHSCNRVICFSTPTPVNKNFSCELFIDLLKIIKQYVSKKQTINNSYNISTWFYRRDSFYLILTENDLEEAFKRKSENFIFTDPKNELLAETKE